MSAERHANRLIFQVIAAKLVTDVLATARGLFDNLGASAFLLDYLLVVSEEAGSWKPAGGSR